MILILLFNACAQVPGDEALEMVRKVAKEMPLSFHSNHRLVTCLLDALMKCNDIPSAESLFNRTTNKTLPMYGAMMNGKIDFLFNTIQCINVSRLYKKSTSKQSH